MTNSWRRHARRFAAEGVLTALGYYLGTVLLERLGVHISWLFVYPTALETWPYPSDATVDVPGHPNELTAEDRRSLFGYGGETLVQHFVQGVSRGRCCAIGRWHGQLASTLWISNRPGGDAKSDVPYWYLWGAFTLPSYRGRHLMSATLKGACDWIRRRHGDDAPILVAASVFNHSSLSGIRRAGFTPIAKVYEIGKRHWRRSLVSAQASRAVSAQETRGVT